METLLHFTEVLLPLIYLGLWVVYLMVFYKDDPLSRRLTRPMLAGVLLLHLGALLTHAAVLRRLPLASVLEFLSGLALALLLIYAVLELRYRVKQTGFIIIGLAGIFQFLSSAFDHRHEIGGSLLQEPGYATHAILILLAYTALSLAFLYSLIYVFQARSLAKRRFGLFYRRLPSLELLERMSLAGVKIGVPLLLASLVSGHLWMQSLSRRLAPEMATDLSHTDPKILIAWATLIIYVLGLVGHRFLGWRGRRMGYVAILAYLFIIVSTGLVQHFFPSFHNFDQAVLR